MYTCTHRASADLDERQGKKEREEKRTKNHLLDGSKSGALNLYRWNLLLIFYVTPTSWSDYVYCVGVRGLCDTYNFAHGASIRTIFSSLFHFTYILKLTFICWMPTRNRLIVSGSARVCRYKCVRACEQPNVVCRHENVIKPSTSSVYWYTCKKFFFLHLTYDFPSFETTKSLTQIRLDISR